MTPDQIHTGIAKPYKPATLIYLDDRHAAVEKPAQHGIGPVVGSGDPGRAGLLQLGLHPVNDLLVPPFLADRIRSAEEIPRADNIIEKDQNNEHDAGNN